MEKNFAAIVSGGTGSPASEMSELNEAIRDEVLDEAVRLTFPASDPIAISFTSRFNDVLRANRH